MAELSLVFRGKSVYENRKCISNGEISSNEKKIAVPSTFPMERGGEKSCFARRGPRSVVWYVISDFGVFLLFKVSLKSKTGLMCTPSILYDRLGGRYMMWDLSRNVIVLICSCSVCWFFMVSGLS